jgi:hypothetical protein
VAQARPLVAAGYLNVPDYLAFAFEAKPEEQPQEAHESTTEPEAAQEEPAAQPKRKRSK